MALSPTMRVRRPTIAAIAATYSTAATSLAGGTAGRFRVDGGRPDRHKRRNNGDGRYRDSQQTAAGAVTCPRRPFNDHRFLTPPALAAPNFGPNGAGSQAALHQRRRPQRAFRASAVMVVISTPEACDRSPYDEGNAEDDHEHEEEEPRNLRFDPSAIGPHHEDDHP